MTVISTASMSLTLCIDIGGTSIKMLIVSNGGQVKTDYLSEPTPKPATHQAVLASIQRMIHQEALSFDRVAAGFPGVITSGVVQTAHNLHPSWIGKNLQQDLEAITGKPARVANDADVQGYGDILGQGVELVITLGTGVGSALFIDGRLVPNLELGHHPFMDNQTYEEVLGKTALKEHGVDRWNALLRQAVALWAKIFNYQYLYLGGGYAQEIAGTLAPNVKISSNINGILGGIRLWAS